jgi:hypothetical protein
LALGLQLAIDGTLVAARRVGDVVYLALTYTPRLAVEQLGATTSAAEREAALAMLTPADVLPGIRVDGGARVPLLAEGDCHVQPASTSLAIQVSAVVAIDLASPTLARTARCFLGGTEALYMSAAHLYLATTRSAQATLQDGRVVYVPTFATDIHKFAFSGLAIGYRSSGEVPGHLGWDAQRMALRMSEHGGDLRVLTFTGATGWLNPADAVQALSPSPATLTILRESAGTLQAVAALPNARRPGPLGKPGEQVLGVRFAGARAYLVTFRRVDPLYVLDLSDAADPRVAGVLEVPGYSDYLLALENNLLLGVGRNADTQGVERGVKLALFDLRDPSRPALVAERQYGARGSNTALDFDVHGLNLHMQGGVARVTLPMSLRATDWAPTATHALHRFEIDTVQRSLLERPALAAPLPDSDWDLSGDRALQAGDTVIWLTQGRLLGVPW